MIRRNDRAALAALALCLIVVLAGCGGGGSGAGNGGGNADPLVGAWRITRLAGDGDSVACPGSLSLSNTIDGFCGPNDVVRFNADGTFLALTRDEFQNVYEAGTWSRSGDTLTVTITRTAYDNNKNGTFEPSEGFDNNPPQLSTLQVIARSGNTMTLRGADGGATVDTTFSRL
jgi:hypothetical protein